MPKVNITIVMLTLTAHATIILNIHLGYLLESKSLRVLKFIVQRILRANCSQATAILRHAWLNLWDKHMTTGRINQVVEPIPPRVQADSCPQYIQLRFFRNILKMGQKRKHILTSPDRVFLSKYFQQGLPLTRYLVRAHSITTRFPEEVPVLCT